MTTNEGVHMKLIPSVYQTKWVTNPFAPKFLLLKDNTIFMAISVTD